MILRLLIITALLSIGVSAPAQTERSGTPHPDDDSGLIIRHDELVDLKNTTELRTLDKSAHTLGDFSVCFALRLEKLPGGDHPIGIALLESEEEVLQFDVTPNGGVVCRYQESRWFGRPEAFAPGQTVHVALSVKRDPRQALAGLWIEGIEQQTFVVRPGTMKLEPSALSCGAPQLEGSISDIRVHDRALTRPEIIKLSTRSSVAKPAAFAGQFSVDDGEVIAALGGTETVGLIESAWLETALMVFASGKKVSLRDLSWEADTVLRQDRPMNFGNLTQQLQRTGTTTVMLMFGRQDCIEMGASGASTFHDALEKIIQTCAAQTRRLIIVGPVPFEKKEPPLPDLSPKNAALRDYNETLLALAEENRGLFVDVIAAWPKEVTRWTTDGLTMTETGHHVLAQIIARQLWNGLPLDSTAAPLRNTIIQKNKLWHDYWRPSNWAFLHGDRTTQPSSRDHLNPSVRWFPAELEKYRELIAAKENEIRKLADERGGKLP